ncbi:Ger(x)C family spore germination protein [Paenibacillus sp. YIM B09110]|uniref:Ger(x)C family spore germination protein n=1 Tax=Paenibacillus sp. YIM B09110 TaxID=3126102 RepID=UPI00301D27C3
MRERLVTIIMFLLMPLTLTGCWDTNHIVDQRIISGVGLDLEQNNNIVGTVRALRLESKGAGQFKLQDELVQSSGKSLLEIGVKLDNMLAGKTVGNKTHIIIINEQLAKQGIYEPLEYFYRNSKSYIGSKVIISLEPAVRILSVDKLEKSPISFDILQTIKGAERSTTIPVQSLYTLWSKMLDTSRDTILPLIRMKQSENLILDSIALFHGDRFTGETITGEDSTLLLLLMNELSKTAIINVEIEPIRSNNQHEESTKEIISFNTMSMKRNMQVTVDEASQAITCSIKVHLYVEIVHYPYISGVEKEKEKLSKAIATSLNRKAEAITKKLLKANCDVFGIEGQMSAFHPKRSNRMDWDEEYRNIQIKPEFIVHINGSGLLK